MPPVFPSAMTRQSGLCAALVCGLAFLLNACSSGGGSPPATAATLDARAGYDSVTLSWSGGNASSYNLYYSTAPNCDIANYTTCPGGTMVAGVSSPYTVSGLSNGQNYWFKLESTAGNTATSNEVGARPEPLVTDNAVNAIARDSTGVTYLGGDFSYIGLRSGYGVPFSLSSGYAGAFPLVNGAVYAAAPDGSGGYYIGGAFTQVEGQNFNRLAHIQADGTLDSTWNPTANGVVLALAVSGSTIYVGGNFTSITTPTDGTLTRNYLAAINSDGSAAVWDPNLDGTVYALTIFGSTVYAGGNFTKVGGSLGSSRNHLAAIKADGTADTWAPDPDGPVYALAVDAGGTVYAGGFFINIVGSPCNYLAAIQTDSNLGTAILDTAFPDTDNTVSALAVSGSTLYVGGSFASVGACTTCNRLAAIGTDGTINSAWNHAPDNVVRVLAVSSGLLYVGGDFTSIDGQTRYHLAAFHSDGTLAGWDPSTSGSVRALAVSSSMVYAGGSFTSIGGQPRNRLAAINADGSLSSWNPDADNSVRAFAVSGTTIYAGGDFTTIGGTPRSRLAAIGSDGSLDGSWDPGANGTVYALAVSGGMVYAGGSFTSVGAGGLTRNRLADIDTTNGNVGSWDPNADNTVRALAVSGTTIYMGGDFSMIGIATRNRLAAVDVNGTLDTTWNPNANSSVRALAVYGSDVYAGGYFTKIGNKNRNRLAAIAIADGSPGAWDPNANNAVQTLVVSGTTVYVGGDFTSLLSGPATVTRNRLAAIDTIDTTGQTVMSWDPNADSTVYALSASASTVYAGGAFTSIGGESNPDFAMLAP